MLPQTLTKYFWDAPLGSIDRNRNKSYVIARILELGDEATIQWLENSYSHDELQQAVMTNRSLSPKSRTYWKLKYNLVSHA